MSDYPEIGDVTSGVRLDSTAGVMDTSPVWVGVGEISPCVCTSLERVWTASTNSEYTNHLLCYKQSDRLDKSQYPCLYILQHPFLLRSGRIVAVSQSQNNLSQSQIEHKYYLKYA